LELSNVVPGLPVRRECETQSADCQKSCSEERQLPRCPEKSGGRLLVSIKLIHFRQKNGATRRKQIAALCAYQSALVQKFLRV
jgi:hypothetical protein